MWETLVSAARQLLADVQRALPRAWRPAPAPPVTAAPPVSLEPLQRVMLTDGVGRTLFEEYAAHRSEARGDEETGWLLMGLRRGSEAVVLATLPAGAERDAGVAHVRFYSPAQELGSRIVRQADRRLEVVGVVHTHPGSLRHPSDADYQGDREWVRYRRGGEGIFGIGTADGKPGDGLFASQPRPHVQCLGELALSWYALRHTDARYRPLPVELTLGPDMARPLHNIWSLIEGRADQLNRLFQQQAGVRFRVVGDPPRGLVVHVPLAEPEALLSVFLEEDEVRYYLVRGKEVLAADCSEQRVDRGIYLLLAELAAQS